jgi:hypothetical protein
MTSDQDFAAHLRNRIAVIAPDVVVDTSVVVPGGRRRKRVTALAGVAATTLVLAGGGWVAASAVQVHTAVPGASTEEWTAPAWFAEQAAQRAAFRADLQSCVDARGWAYTVDEWGGSDHGFTDETELDRFVADVDDCSAALGRDPSTLDSEAATRSSYPLLVDTWECVVHQGYDVPPPPTEDELVRQTELGSRGRPWTPYGDLGETWKDDWSKMLELEAECPAPW